jgi:hypothetical protein
MGEVSVQEDGGQMCYNHNFRTMKVLRDLHEKSPSGRMTPKSLIQNINEVHQLKGKCLSHDKVVCYLKLREMK